MIIPVRQLKKVILPAPFGTDQGGDFPLPNPDIQFIQGSDTAELHGQVNDFKDGIVIAISA